MAKSQPYQPFLLRIFHSISGVLTVAALITGYWVYNTYDGRFGALPLPQIPDIQGLHGTFGLFFLVTLPLLAIYSLFWGHARLVQGDVVKRLTQRVGHPVWWYTLQRLANTAMLLAATAAVVSGRMMQEAWLPAGETYHLWYSLHLLAWALMGLALVVHILMSLKVGGVPLLLSMVPVGYRPEDSPRHWWPQIKAWLPGRK
ncbi:MAG: cytochrome b/b6 domain-containing protein [Leptolyngbya sp.]|nr:cytochrome b/b6 domain-containing protein [Leptolyngbya sp.]